MLIFNIYNNKCPICKASLIYNVVRLPGGKILPCKECKSCTSFFYKESNYNKLVKTAKSVHKEVGHNVYPYIKAIDSFEIEKPKQHMKIKKQNQPTKSKASKKKKKVYVPEEPPKIIRQYNGVDLNTCRYYHKGVCDYINDFCRPWYSKCKYRNKFSNTQSIEKKSANTTTVQKERQSIKKRSVIVDGVTAIVINDNRKCSHEQHKIEDVNAILRIVIKNGSVIKFTVPAAYCHDCNMYFILKHDYLRAKERGAILCKIIDRTQPVSKQISKRSMKACHSTSLISIVWDIM